MSWERDLLMMYQERGYGPSDKYVCAECFGDPYLKRYIRKHGSKGACSFCKNGNHPAIRNVMPLEGVMPLIMDVVRQEYLPAFSYAVRDSETKEYLEPVINPWNFVREELNQYMNCRNEKLLQELENILDFENRVSIYNWTVRQEEEDLYEWEYFCTLVKASRLSAEQIVSECGRKRATPSLVSMKRCMDKIYSYVVENAYLTSMIKPTATIYRSGKHIKESYTRDYDIPVIPAALIGTAPAMDTTNNRMSEKGDMMFYGAFQENVATAEIDPEEGDTITVGKFHTNKQITVLDFTKFTYRSCPSIFDQKNREKRSQWFFIRELLKRISGRANTDDDKFYKPTQVFTKYIQRHTKFAGIIYPSSKFPIEYRNDGKPHMEKSLVLFIENRACLEEGDTIDKRRLQLIMEPQPRQYIYGK